MALQCERSASSGDTKSVSSTTHSDDDMQLRRMNTFVGTAQYVSPEMLSDSAVAGFASDLWALGCIVYQMVVGYSPFQSGSEDQTFQMILATQYDMPEDVSEEARDLISKLLVSDPAERLGFRNLGELKAHPFFHGIDFATLPFTPAPQRIHHDRSQSLSYGSVEDDMGAEFGMASHTMRISIDDNYDPDDDDDDERTPMVGQVFGGHHAQRIMPFNFIEAASRTARSPRSTESQQQSSKIQQGRASVEDATLTLKGAIEDGADEH